MSDNPKQPSWLFMTFAAASILMMTMGARQSLGLFVFPLNNATGLGLVMISFAMAVGQFVWGAVQPIGGALADRYGPTRVLVAGVLILAMGTALTPLMPTAFGLVLTLGLLSATGTGITSFSVLIGAVANRVPVAQRGIAAGIINAGGSFGQFIFAPLLQTLILLLGWTGAMGSLAFIMLAALPLVRVISGSSAATGAKVEHDTSDGGMRRAVKIALADRSYLLLHAGFFTCGFHVAFIVTHFPGEVMLWSLSPAVASWSLAIIGLGNIGGSLLAGWCLTRHLGKYVLFGVYGSRALLVLLFLAAPKTSLTFYLFAVGLGFTWLATVPPTAGVISKLFGTRYLGTLFGLTLLSHQTGGFLGAWLGGICFSYFGDYRWMWYADVVLATAAALCNLPIREPGLEREFVPA
jgi:MFS family permease